MCHVVLGDLPTGEFPTGDLPTIFLWWRFAHRSSTHWRFTHRTVPHRRVAHHYINFTRSFAHCPMDIPIPFQRYIFSNN